MSTRTRRRKPAALPAQPPPPAGQGKPAYDPVPMPKWNWRTFPVYFAFSIGGFLGLYMGLIATASETLQFVFVFWALLLGFGFSRLTSRWMMSRRWGQARLAKRRAGK